MSKVVSILAALVPIAVAGAVAPPTPSFERLVRDLASDESDVWRRASEQLWKAGDAAKPALVAASKHVDPDVRLRALVILSRFARGIYPDTPPTVVKEIDRFWDGNREERLAAARNLEKLGRAGFLVLPRLLATETDQGVRAQIAEQLKRLLPRAARELIAEGKLAEAEVCLEAAGNSEAAMRDLAAFLALTGRAAKSNQEPSEVARRKAYLHRAKGDLKAARLSAEKADDRDLLFGILGELFEYKDLVKLNPPLFKNALTRACLLSRAGDAEGASTALKEIDQKEAWRRAAAFFYNDQPSKAIDALLDPSPGTVCSLLGVQGRWHEALALTAKNTPVDRRESWLLAAQADAARRMGDKEKMRGLAKQILTLLEKSLPQDDSLLATLLESGRKSAALSHAVRTVGEVLDRRKLLQPSSYVLSNLNDTEAAAIELWWIFLRKHDRDAPPSALLTRLHDWFNRGKAGKDFDAILVAAERFADFPGETKSRWPAALAAACVAVGQGKKAEDVLAKAARATGAPADHHRLGDFLFARKRWAEAAEAYARALGRDPTDCEALYLRGVALGRMGRDKEGRALVERARILPLADEATRYTLIGKLDRLQLSDESAAESLLLVRTSTFWSIYTSNVVFALGDRAAREKRFSEAAAFYRRANDNHVVDGGGYTDSRANLVMPGYERVYEARGLIQTGKLEEAKEAAARVWAYLPLENEVAIDLIRALDKANRKAEADLVFADRFGVGQRACVAAPLRAANYNGLAWLAARCGRKLDAAVKHAKRATELAPTEAAWLDTLAEVHFQRGETKEAMAAIEAALKLSPEDAYLLGQAQRIKAGNAKAELP